jgi:hypothetical protein
MRKGLRENAPRASAAAAACAAMAWLGLYGFAWNDYDTEARPAYEALLHGHLLGFLRLAPAYGGSLIERAPFALTPGLWGGGSLAVYRAVALPCLLASAVLGVWLVARMRAQGRSTLARAVVLGVCVANPITLRALEVGHPEELLGGCMCVAAVLLAATSGEHRGRSLLAGALLGLAIANKEWALLAVGPVVAATAPGQRVRCLLAAGASAAAILAPLALVSSGTFAATTRAVAAASGSPIFQPWQLWWFLGHHGALVHGGFGVAKPGYRRGPPWTMTVDHPLILAVGVALALALWLRSRRTALTEQNALLALALVLLARCVLDTWDAIYYALPFVLALVAWEAGRPRDSPPLLALAASALAWVSFQWLPTHASPDVQAACFLAWSLPLGVWLTATLTTSLRAPASPGEHRLQRRPSTIASETIASANTAPAASADGQETTVSSLGRLVKTS